MYMLSVPLCLTQMASSCCYVSEEVILYFQKIKQQTSSGRHVTQLEVTVTEITQHADSGCSLPG